MLEFLINNIFVEFGGHNFQQIIYIPMGTNCAPFFFDDFFLYSYDTEFIQKQKRITEAKGFNLTFRYIDDILSIHKSKLC